ncbi:MAG TPA: hypothetical protein VLV49_19320 [Terriglobales bacterium]|nr:hypothetical protein [Terriglobales bacterium]
MPDPLPHRRRLTVIASGLLCGALGLVVLFTSRRAFFSPLALVVVAAIGLTAVLLQLRLYNRKLAKDDPSVAVHPPLWLNATGILLAVAALLADWFRLQAVVSQALALGAVISFAVSGAIILHAFRRRRIAPKPPEA